MDDQFSPGTFSELIVDDLENGFIGEVRPDLERVQKLHDYLEEVDSGGRRALAGARSISEKV